LVFEGLSTHIHKLHLGSKIHVQNILLYDIGKLTKKAEVFLNIL